MDLLLGFFAPRGLGSAASLPKIELMLAKRAAYYLMAAGPFLLLGLIGINSRMNTNHWDFVEYGPETSSHVLAYSEAVRQARMLVASQSTEDHEAVNKAVSFWLAGRRSGALRDIPPATTDEEGSTAIFEQVLWARNALEDSCVRVSVQLIEAGRHDEAAQLLCDLIELSDTGKYSEFGSVSSGAATQATALQMLAQVTPFLTEERRAESLRRLRMVETDPERSLLQVINRFAVVYSADRMRVNESTTLLEVAREQRKLASNEDDALTVRIREWQKISTSDRSLLSSYGRSRIAYVQQRRFEAEMAQTRSLLETKVP